MAASDETFERPLLGVTNATNISAVELVADAMYSLSTASSSEYIADEFDFGQTPGLDD